MTVRMKSVVSDAEQVQLGAELARLGARLQVLETETNLSRERLLRLYKEVVGQSPPKGMLPFSTDWFMSWMPNIHASIFMNIHAYLLEHTQAKGIRAIITAYRLYIEHVELNDLEKVLSFTRAWSLARFFEAKLLETTPCKSCGGKFVVHTMDLTKDYECGLCNVPSRAGKTKKKGAEEPAKIKAVRAPAPENHGFLLGAAMSPKARRGAAAAAT